MRRFERIEKIDKFECEKVKSHFERTDPTIRAAIQTLNWNQPKAMLHGFHGSDGPETVTNHFVR
jgi:hypothetical protein